VPRARLWMIGTGPEAARLRECAGDGVELLGSVSRRERDERMNRAHALIATSVREGWGLVVSEAAAVGTGAVADAVPGLIGSAAATGGRLVAPTVRALAKEMLRVAAEPPTAPVPVATGTVSYDAVARLLLDRAEAGASA